MTDPNRVLSSGETLAEALRRMYAIGGGDRLEAMRYVRALMREEEYSRDDAEDVVYGDFYSVEKYPWPENKDRLKRNQPQRCQPNLEDFLRNSSP